MNLLFIAPVFMLWRAFTSEPTVMAQWLVAFGLVLLSAYLMREGLRAQEAFEARAIARRPAPRKVMSAIAMGAGMGVAGFAGHGLFDAAIFASLGTVMTVLAFGIDPLDDKGMEGDNAFQTERVARAVDEAEKHLGNMTSAIKRAGIPALERRVSDFQGSVRTMFRTIEDDPRDLTGARKYLGVYLLGATDATAKFADLYARNGDETARADYEALLDDLQTSFEARTQKMLTDSRTDLDIEIDVLRDRLAREGIKPE
ncbi:MAG: 5-bromo-4-chloroindolyl phosphate hydrolysis family protein [Pseudomonadota bacterium]